MTTWLLSLRWIAILAAILTGASAARADTVAALAHIQPLHGVVVLSGPPGDAIAGIDVAAGQKVAADQTLIVLQSEPMARSEVALAEVGLKELREQQPLDFDQLRIEVRKADSDLAYAATRLARYDAAGTAKIAPQIYDDQANQLAAAKIMSETKHARLAAVELQNATALERAQANLASAKAKLALTSIRAPADGTILEVMAHPGEATGAGPLLRMADLRQMCVVADVFEGDMRLVALGDRATISSKAMARPVNGRVVEIGRIITRDDKVGKVRILADEAGTLAGLIDAEVDVVIGR